MGCVLEKSSGNGAECSRKVESGRRVAGAIRSLVNDRDLQLQCDRALHETLLVSVLMYGSETLLWKERSRIRAVQMDNLKGLLGIRRMDRVPNAQIRELCGVKKGLDKKIDEGVLLWFSHMERMENDSIATRAYVGECAACHSVGRLQKRWIDAMKDCLRKSKENGAR